MSELRSMNEIKTTEPVMVRSNSDFEIASLDSNEKLSPSTGQMVFKY